MQHVIRKLGSAGPARTSTATGQSSTPNGCTWQPTVEALTLLQNAAMVPNMTESHVPASDHFEIQENRDGENDDESVEKVSQKRVSTADKEKRGLLNAPSKNLNEIQERSHSTNSDGRLFVFDEIAQRTRHALKRIAEFAPGDSRVKSKLKPRRKVRERSVEKKERKIPEWRYRGEYEDDYPTSRVPELVLEPRPTAEWLALACCGPRVRIRDRFIGQYRGQPQYYSAINEAKK